MKTTYDNTIYCRVSSATLARLYEALDKEERPYEATVRMIPRDKRRGGHTHEVTIHNNDSEHFIALLKE
jgi:hypothetical protein